MRLKIYEECDDFRKGFLDLGHKVWQRIPVNSLLIIQSNPTPQKQQILMTKCIR